MQIDELKSIGFDLQQSIEHLVTKLAKMEQKIDDLEIKYLELERKGVGDKP